MSASVLASFARVRSKAPAGPLDTAATAADATATVAAGIREIGFDIELTHRWSCMTGLNLSGSGKVFENTSAQVCQRPTLLRRNRIKLQTQLRLDANEQALVLHAALAHDLT
jgi:hypothetical protein